MTGKLKLTLKLKSKILLIIIPLLILFGSLTFIIVRIQVNKLVIMNLNKSLDSNIKLSYNILDMRYPGMWRVEGENLYKGNKLINGDTDFVDFIKNATSSPTTIFLGDTRVATNVIKDGERAVGTKVAQQVADEVLNKGNEFGGEVLIVDSMHEAKYVPIKDSNGKAIGIFFIGIEKAKITAEINSLMINIGLTMLGVLVLSVILTMIATNPIAKNVNNIKLSLSKIAAGDLTTVCTVMSKDEIGEIAQSVNDMKNNMNILVDNIRNDSENLQLSAENLSQVSEEMSTSSDEVARSIQDVAKGTEEQANDLTDITYSLSKFGEDIDNIVCSIKDIDSSSSLINNMSKESNKDMNQLVASVENVSSSFNEFTSKITQLGKNINRVTEITNVINSIADQTNLLALNASIEAARAGEAGRGFTVVATNIRDLAEQSKSSSKDINMLIESISNETLSIIKSTNLMNLEIGNQMNMIDTTIESFRKIITSIDEISPKIEAVASSAASVNEEKNGISSKIESSASIAEEVSASSEEIAASSQEMSASSQEVTATAQSLYSMTQKMLSQINKFKL
jgi:methyl-accepting chemotaxis protein